MIRHKELLNPSKHNWPPGRSIDQTTIPTTLNNLCPKFCQGPGFQFRRQGEKRILAAELKLSPLRLKVLHIAYKLLGFFLSSPFIIKVPFFLLFGCDTGTLKYTGKRVLLRNLGQGISRLCTCFMEGLGISGLSKWVISMLRLALVTLVRLTIYPSAYLQPAAKFPNPPNRAGRPGWAIVNRHCGINMGLKGTEFVASLSAGTEFRAYAW